MDTKQVIVVRKDLNMRKGKIAAQCAHAAMSFLTKNGQIQCGGWGGDHFALFIDNAERLNEISSWLDNSFKKIVVWVASEGELLDVHEAVLKAGLESHLIEDNGTTEFNGVPTKTCCAIGPHFSDKFEDLTGHLPLL